MSRAPLAHRMRPRALDEVVGQRHLLGPGGPLSAMAASGTLHSLILWGPPGSGKTTIATLLAQAVEARFVALSAVSATVKDVRAVIEQARAQAGQTVLFLDEVHRFNKAQQDALLPAVETGLVVLIGATTENPSFEVIGALLSRAPVYVLQRLDEEDLKTLLRRALGDKERGVASAEVSPGALDLMAALADGDARRAYNLLEATVEALGPGTPVDEAAVRRLAPKLSLAYDKGGEAFYDLISALHKSVRGSAVDASLYWLCRMLQAGAEPLYIARRLVRMASEDIGNADPHALDLALNAWEVQERLGSPEGELALAQAVVYLALAPKSNATYLAYQAAMEDAAKGSPPVPLHLRNAPTSLMRQLGYGKGYRYAHDEPGAYAAGEHYFPEGMREGSYYHPTGRGHEARLKERMEELLRLEKQKS